MACGPRCIRPFFEHPGTGAYVHLSLNSATQDGRQTEQFLAGNLQHFPAVSAFAFTNELSYGRSLVATLTARVDDPFNRRSLSGGPSSLSADQRAALRIQTRVPTSLEESLSALEQSEAMRQYLGGSIFSIYLSVEKGELEEFRHTTADETPDWIISRL
ncbi:hypothetical protein BDV09DRAFT_198553 [Aspergillus tetrazonus]